MCSQQCCHGVGVLSGDDSVLVVPANHSLLYVWGNPLAPHQLLWKVHGQRDESWIPLHEVYNVPMLLDVTMVPESTVICSKIFHVVNIPVTFFTTHLISASKTLFMSNNFRPLTSYLTLEIAGYLLASCHHQYYHYHCRSLC